MTGSQWSEFDEIHLIVCRPIQREIDEQKNRGNDRVGRRARQTHSEFRKIIIGELDYKLIQEASPQVKLFINPECYPSPSLINRLDYSETDDQLVGCVQAFKEQNPKSDVRLLTHDSGPMGSAQMIALSFVAIPDDWLRPPENNNIERENRRLRSELAQLKKAEPQFEISFVNSERNELNSLKFERVKYQPLTEYEISRMLNSLKDMYLINTNILLDVGYESAFRQE